MLKGQSMSIFWSLFFGRPNGRQIISTTTKYHAYNNYRSLYNMFTYGFPSNAIVQLRIICPIQPPLPVIYFWIRHRCPIDWKTHRYCRRSQINVSQFVSQIQTESYTNCINLCTYKLYTYRSIHPEDWETWTEMCRRTGVSENTLHSEDSQLKHSVQSSGKLHPPVGVITLNVSSCVNGYASHIVIVIVKKNI